MVAVRVEGMMKLLLLVVVIGSQTNRCLAAGETATSIRRDITESICTSGFFQQVSVHLRYCRNDGFSACSKYRHHTYTMSQLPRGHAVRRGKLALIELTYGGLAINTILFKVSV